MMLFLAAAMVALDQLSKAWVVKELPLGASVPVGLGFSFTHTRNGGAAFGLLRDLRLELLGRTIDGTFLLGVLSAVVAVALAVYLQRHRGKLGRLVGGALALVLAGAIGNMIDRFRLGYVVDFIHFQVGSFNFPVFNVADCCVVIGAGLLLLASLIGPHDQPAVKRGPAPREHRLEELPELPAFGRRGPGDDG